MPLFNLSSTSQLGFAFPATFIPALIGKLALFIFIVSVGALIWKLIRLITSWYTTKLGNLPGPPSPSWIFGNLKTIRKEAVAVPQERWVEEYGSTTLMYRGLLNKDRLWTLDTCALNHILTHSVDYQKPDIARRNLAQLLGEGVLFTEAEQHRQQRRIMNPAFGPAQIRELTEIFIQKSIELRDAWESEISASDSPIDVLKWLSKTTLDIIGLAGFNYRFDALNPHGKPNKLNEAFNEIFDPNPKITPLMVLRQISPIFNLIPDAASRRTDRAQEMMRKIGMELIVEKKAAIMSEISGGKEKYGGRGGARDLLTLLLKANMATDIPDNQRLSDEDVLAQVPTFLVAGHETTSTATMWCLFALTQALDVQKKLREELLAVDTDTPDMDQLNALLYLDAVVRETLRVHSPVPNSIRVATRDDVIPVGEPFVDRFGKVQDHIEISKGSAVIIPILALNRAKKLWGDDAHVFKPERWENIPEAVSSIPGVWAHLLTFLGGPRACIGYRFSLVEMKALLFTLVRTFEFELAVPVEDVEKKSTVVQRPLIRSAREHGSHMPLRIRRYHQ